MDREKLMNALELERVRLLDTVKNLERWGFGDTETDRVGELSSYDQHPADHGTETFERQKDLGLKENALLQLQRVEQAIERLQNGSYGTCERCGREISEERLDAIPYAVLCIRCKQEEERFGDDEPRPVEEKVLHPGYSFRAARGDVNGFDGEDAWQAVARYGTANSPQDVSGEMEYDEAFLESDEDIGAADPLDRLEDVKGNGATDLDAFYPDPEKGTRRR